VFGSLGIKKQNPISMGWGRSQGLLNKVRPISPRLNQSQGEPASHVSWIPKPVPRFSQNVRKHFDICKIGCFATKTKGELGSTVRFRFIDISFTEG
jgi:hypothetical protein